MADSYDPQGGSDYIKQKIFDRYGITSDQVKGLTPSQQKNLPSTVAGATALEGIGQASFDPNVGGFSAQDVKDKHLTNQSYLMLNSNPKTNLPEKEVMAHEMEHVLANQGLTPYHYGMNQEWDKLIDSGSTEDQRGAVVKRLIEHAPYLQKKWGLDDASANSGYFSPNVLNDKLNGHSAYLYEQLATLSALEQMNKKKLTDDPYVRNNILTTRDQRETYNALTGLRQSRLDPHDLAPYTRYEEKSDPSTLTKIKNALGFSAGGSIDKPINGNSKLI
jgi:hypothetical protein